MFGSSFDPGADPWETPLGAAIAQASVPTLIAAFRLRACWFESFPFDVQFPRIEPGRVVLPPEEPGVASAGGAVELPVQYRGLTLGRFVLVPDTPTCGVGFSPMSRAEAISLVAPLGERIAAAIVAEDDTEAGLVQCEPPRAHAPRRRGARRRRQSPR